MKKKSLFCLFATAMLIAGCNDDNKTTGGGGVEEGKPTTFTLAFSQPGTRASISPTDPPGSNDDNATIAETTLHTVDILIFHKNGALESHQTLDPSSFTYSAGSNNKDVFSASARNIHTTTGDKLIYAGVNLPPAMVTQIKSSATDRKVDCIYEIPTLGQLSDISASGLGMAMFNADYVEANFIENPLPAENVVVIELKRLSVKVAVKLGDPVTKDGGITYSDMEYTVGNINKKIYPMPQYLYRDPNYESALASDGRPTYRHDFTIDPVYIPINPANTAVRSLGVKYIPENTSTRQYKDETSYVSIRMAFKPDNILIRDGNGGFINEAFDDTTYDPTTDEMYVVRTKTGKMTFFLDQTIADEYKTYLSTQFDMPADQLTFTDLVCHYTVFINLDPSKTNTEATVAGNVIRNEFYLMTIADIGTIGSPYPREPGEEDDPKDPGHDGGDEIEKPTDITLSLEIVPWTLVDDGGMILH